MMINSNNSNSNYNDGEQLYSYKNYIKYGKYNAWLIMGAVLGN